MVDLNTLYTTLSLIFPSQVRFSRQNVEDKIKYALQGDAWYLPSTRSYGFRYDGYQSIFGPEAAIPIITTPKRLILADGHHSVLASLALGCKTIPIRPIAHWPHDLNSAFWQWAEDHNYAYLWDLDGKKLPPPQSFLDLKDDPLRYFAAITARKYPSDRDPLKSFGLDYPLWIKIGKDIPFIEMRIANTLFQAGFSYRYGQELSSDFTSLVEQAREILRGAPIPGLRLLTTREHYLSSSTIAQWLEE